MRHDEIWEASTGKPLALGQKVKVSEDNPYYHDGYAGIEFFVTGLHFESDGQTVNITIGESMGSRESDGWKVFDLLPAA